MNKQNKDLIKNTINNVDKVEDLIITMIYSMNGQNKLDFDDDLYFLSDMLKLTRSYGNLLEELSKIGDEPQP